MGASVPAMSLGRLHGRFHRVARWAVPAALMTFTLVTARAATPEVEAGKAAFLKGDFRGSLARLEEASKSPSVTEADLVEVHWYRGAAFFALGKKKKADKEFDEVLALRPLYAPNKLETPPDVRAAFKKRSDRYQSKLGVTLEPPTLADGKLRVALGGHLEEAKSVAVFIRPVGDIRYQQLDLPVAEGAAQGALSERTLWERAEKNGKLEVVVEVHNQRGTPVARLGDAQEPLALAVSPEMAQAALAALKKAAPAQQGDPSKGTQQATAEPDNPQGNQTPSAGESSGSNPLGFVALAAGGGLVAGSLLPLLLGVAALVGSGISGGVFGYTYYQFNQPGSDLQRDALIQRWELAQVLLAILVPSAAAALLLATLLGVTGVGTMMLKAVF